MCLFIICDVKSLFCNMEQLKTYCELYFIVMSTLKAFFHQLFIHFLVSNPIKSLFSL